MAQKFNALIDKANELGISLYFESGVCIIHVLDDQKSYRVQDLEDPDHNNEFPPVLEFKILVEEV